MARHIVPEVVGGPQAPKQTLAHALHKMHTRIGGPGVQWESQEHMCDVRTNRRKGWAPLL